jgi:hypothetical protein
VQELRTKCKFFFCLSASFWGLLELLHFLKLLHPKFDGTEGNWRRWVLGRVSCAARTGYTTKIYDPYSLRDKLFNNNIIIMFVITLKRFYISLLIQLIVFTCVHYHIQFNVSLWIQFIVFTPDTINHFDHGTQWTTFHHLWVIGLSVEWH